jgi:hypothetical protein
MEWCQTDVSLKPPPSYVKPHTTRLDLNDCIVDIKLWWKIQFEDTGIEIVYLIFSSGHTLVHYLGY